MKGDKMGVMKNFTVHPKAAAPLKHYEGRELSDVYGTYSGAKYAAYEYCFRLFKETDGEDFTISSHNTHTFTVMWDFINPDNGRPMRAHITPAHNHAYYL